LLAKLIEQVNPSQKEPVVCMLGKTGSGKSTLCNALMTGDDENSNVLFKTSSGK
jgi:predicted GTPase